jgi:hypothetical protein
MQSQNNTPEEDTNGSSSMTNHHKAFQDCVRCPSPGGEFSQPPVEDFRFYILLVVFVAFVAPEDFRER